MVKEEPLLAGEKKKKKKNRERRVCEREEVFAYPFQQEGKKRDKVGRLLTAGEETDYIWKPKKESANEAGGEGGR